MNKIERLKDELNRVISAAAIDRINLCDIAKENNISYRYALQIKNGNSPKYNTKENCELLQRLIHSCRKRNHKLNNFNYV